MFLRSKNNIDLKNWIKEEAKKLNFASVGFAKPIILKKNSNWLIEFIKKKYHGDMIWMENKSEIRRSPLTLWRNSKTAIVLSYNYAPDHNPLDTIKSLTKGNISVYARGRDYHAVIKGKLKELSSKIISKTKLNAKVFVDTAPIMEKPLAQYSGIGWQGKNTMLVSKDFGCWLFLGIILIDKDLPTDLPMEDNCGSCNACLNICPTKAFKGPYKLDASKCISYLTIEYKGHIPVVFRKQIGNRIFGCDDCLAVCPWNKFAKNSNELKFKNKSNYSFTNLENLLQLSELNYRKIFSKTPVRRAGYNSFMRNVLIASGNSKSRKLTKLILPHLENKSPIIRAMSVWALGQISDLNFMHSIYKKQQNENDIYVKNEWDKIISKKIYIN